MAEATRPHTLAEKLADLENPTPYDFDPEGFGDAFDRKYQDSDSNEVADTTPHTDGREHYEAVTKSKLRGPQESLLGKQYTGAQIKRDALEDGDEDSNSSFGWGPEGDESGSDTSGATDEEYADPDDAELEGTIEEDDEIDSDEAFGEGDEEKYSKFVFRASKHNFEEPSSVANDTNSVEDEAGERNSRLKPRVSNRENKSTEGSDFRSEDAKAGSPSSEASSKVSESDEEDSEMENNMPFLNEDGASIDKEAIRAIMASDQKSIVASVAQAVKADAAKGLAVRHQRDAFNALLNTRICLQKALIGTNSFSQPAQSVGSTLSLDLSAIEAAESAAIELFNGLTALRVSLSMDAKSNERKRPFSATLSTPISDYHQHIKSMDAGFRPKHRYTLTKWAEKTHLATSLPSRNNFAAVSSRPLTSVLDSQLSGSSLDNHISKTMIPRNCAPIQAQAGLQEDRAIYDDADWYSFLLRELVDSKLSSAAVSSSLAQSRLPGDVEGFDRSLSDLRRANKVHRKGVDVKASKGRKMRYAVHEKLQNFDAPRDVGTWDVRQAEELFASLLGRKVKGGLDEALDDQDDEERAAESLRLFRTGGGR